MKKIFWLICLLTSYALSGQINPAVQLFEDDLVFYVSFDDGKGAPLIMDGNIKFIPSAKKTLIDGVSGKALKSGRLQYRFDFKNTTFNQNTTFVYWMALTGDSLLMDKKTINPIILQGKGASLLMQRQGWSKNANIMAVLAIPKKKGPLVRIFNAASPRNWKKYEWHMVAVSWDLNKLCISIDGKSYAQSVLQSSLSAYYNDSSGKINSMIVAPVADVAAIDEIMIFNRILSQDELQRLYSKSRKNNAGKNR